MQEYPFRLFETILIHLSIEQKGGYGEKSWNRHIKQMCQKDMHPFTFLQQLCMSSHNHYSHNKLEDI